MIFTDPFNLDHNLGAGVTRKMANYILTTFIRGRERFGFPRFDIPLELSQKFFFDVYYLTDGYEAPTDRNCRVCGKIGHIAKDCPHSKANRRAEQKKEEEERRLGKEPGGMTQKPFSARPRSASAPNKQGQDKNVDQGTPLSTTQPQKIPPREEPNASSVSHLSRSQPDSQAAPSVKKSPDSKTEDGAENGHERAQTEIPQRELPVQNPPVVVTTENVVPGSHETMLDTNNTQWQSTQATSSSVAKNEIGAVNTITSCGDVVTEPSGVQPLVHLPSPVDSGIRTAVATAGTATVQASHAGGVKPPPGLPPGFYTPDGTPQVSRMSSEGPPPLIAAPAHEWQTLFTGLMQAQNITTIKIVGPTRKTVISLDMGLYQPAKKLQMAFQDLKHIILCPGERQIVMAQLQTISAFMEDSGLDLCWIESELYGPATVKQIINGEHVKRGETAHIQALFVLYQEAFFSKIQACTAVLKNWQSSFVMHVSMASKNN